MSLTLAAYEFRQYFDDDGDPLDGGLVNVYLSGTSTRATSYSDADGTQNTNPVECDSAGRCTIYLDDGLTYRFIVTDADGNPIGLPIDPVTSTGAGSGAGLGEVFDFGGDNASQVTATTYPSGATFDTLHQGTAVFQIDAADLPSGDYEIQATGVMVTSGTLSVAIVDLSSGSPDTPLASLAITSLTGEVATSGVITFGAPGITRSYGIKVKVSANLGFVWGIHLVRV